MIVIYHNPACSASRNVLAAIKSSGHAVKVVEYLVTGWTRAQLLDLFAAANITPRNALRINRSPAEDLGLTKESVSDETLLSAMIEHPILVNRPFVEGPKGARLCRPLSVVRDIVDGIPETFTKEDGQPL
jgi:arsenate reductase